MKRVIFFASALVVLFAVACGGSGGGDNTTPDGAKAQFCEPLSRTRVDFSVLNDVRSILVRYSVFRETVEDPDLLLNSTLETMFSSLGVPNSDIPVWAHDMVDAELASGKRTPDFSVFNDVYNELITDPQYADLQDPSRREELIEGLILGMIDALNDPFASYVPAEVWNSGGASLSGRYQGIGIGLGKNSRNEIEIRSVGDGTPAEDALIDGGDPGTDEDDVRGLKAGDAILEINGRSTEQCSVRQFILGVQALGNPNINLTIARESFTSTEREILEDVEVVMEEIKKLDLTTYPGIDLPAGRGSTADDVQYRCNGKGAVGIPCPLPEDVLYIRIHSFSDQMQQDLEYVLTNADLSQYRGVIVDVRNNGGGLVSATINAVDYFLPTDDYIYTEKDADGNISRSRYNRVTYLDEDVPMVVLTNKDSYSGAELFAAALRDNGRAVIVSNDERTGGKGTVNNHFPLRRGEYGALYVSIRMWLTPSGEMIEAQDLDNDGHYEIGGLTPDIHVPWSPADHRENSRDVNHDPTLQAALEYLRQHMP